MVRVLIVIPCTSAGRKSVLKLEQTPALAADLCWSPHSRLKLTAFLVLQSLPGAGLLR